MAKSETATRAFSDKSIDLAFESKQMGTHTRFEWQIFGADGTVTGSTDSPIDQHDPQLSQSWVQPVDCTTIP